MPINNGQDPTAYKNITCKKCGTINGYLPNEVVVLYKGFDYGGVSQRDGFKCVSCNQDVVVRSW